MGPNKSPVSTLRIPTDWLLGSDRVGRMTCKERPRNADFGVLRGVSVCDLAMSLEFDCSSAERGARLNVDLYEARRLRL